MLKQITSIDPVAPPRHSARFIQLWNRRVLRLPPRGEEIEHRDITDLDQELRAYRRTKKVDGIINAGREQSPWLNNSIGWGRSPSGWTAYQGGIRGLSAKARRTRTGNASTEDHAPVTTKALDELLLKHNPQYVRDPDGEHPRGRMAIGLIAQLPGAQILWESLKPRQQGIAVAHFGLNKTQREIAAECGISLGAVHAAIESIRCKFVEAGFPEPLHVIIDRRANVEVSYSHVRNR